MTSETEMSMKLTAMIAILALTACGQTSDGAFGSTTSVQPPVEATTTTTLPSVDPTSTTSVPAESTTTESIDQSTQEPNDERTAPSDPEYPESAVTEDLLDAIAADAAERTGVDSAQVEIVSVTGETFNNSSLGCPEPGQAYTQVITPGHIVIVRAGDAELDYRVGVQSETFKLCE